MRLSQLIVLGVLLGVGAGGCTTMRVSRRRFPRPQCNLRWLRLQRRA